MNAHGHKGTSKTTQKNAGSRYDDQVNRPWIVASSDQVAHQVFSWERFVLAFQCHPEVRHADIESWLIGHATEIAATGGVSVEQLRKDSHYYGPALAEHARTMLVDWMAGLGLVAAGQ